MALFGRKKNTEKKEVKAEPKVEKPKVVKPAKAVKAIKAPKISKKTGEAHGFSHILSRPRITEKAALMSETSNAYTFEVQKSASKGDVAKAVKELYKITPLKIGITNLPSKTKFIRGKMGTKSGIKKATVFLQKGDKIEFV